MATTPIKAVAKGLAMVLLVCFIAAFSEGISVSGQRTEVNY
jgi:hypothetical protein